MDNKILNVADLLNVNLEEVFRIKFYKHKDIYKTKHYKLTEKGLMYSDDESLKTWCKSDALEGLLLGKHEIIKLNSKVCNHDNLINTEYIRCIDDKAQTQFKCKDCGEYIWKDGIHFEL